jgi:hypothetical protein
VAASAHRCQIRQVERRSVCFQRNGCDAPRDWRSPGGLGLPRAGSQTASTSCVTSSGGSTAARRQNARKPAHGAKRCQGAVTAWNPRSEATSGHFAGRPAKAPQNPWRFKSSHAHGEIRRIRGPIVAQTVHSSNPCDCGPRPHRCSSGARGPWVRRRLRTGICCRRPSGPLKLRHRRRAELARAGRRPVPGAHSWRRSARARGPIHRESVNRSTPAARRHVA